MGKKAGGQAPFEQAEVYTTTSLEQVKILADPLRLRILQAFCAGPRTTKQVAEHLGEKPTRLYHHVDALAGAGLIRLARTRPVRGTVEKYYLSVARVFRADPAVFQTGAAGDAGARALGEMATTALETTTGELRRLVEAGHDLASSPEGLLSHVELQASEAKIREVQDRLMALLKELEGGCQEDGPREGGRRFRLNIAFFPLDRPE